MPVWACILYLYKKENFIIKSLGVSHCMLIPQVWMCSIRDRKELKLEIEVDHHIYPVKTPLIFFGNNQLQLADLNLQIAKDGRGR